MRIAMSRAMTAMTTSSSISVKAFVRCAMMLSHLVYGGSFIPAENADRTVHQHRYLTPWPDREQASPENTLHDHAVLPAVIRFPCPPRDPVI